MPVQSITNGEADALVARFKAGDTSAFAHLYEAYFDAVYAYLHVLLRDAQAAEDATQETFARALAALPRYTSRGVPVAAWLFRIARNHAFDVLRTRSRTEPGEEPLRDLAERPERRGEAWLSDEQLLRSVERLPLPQRQALVLRFMLDMSNLEIAGVMGTTVGNVRTLQSRALRRLRTRLEPVRAAGPTRAADARRGRAAVAGLVTARAAA
jgi:RNA polymerase sigma-70 factor (ECF subfamily)